MIQIVCTWQPWPLGKLARWAGLHWSHAFLLDGLMVYEATMRGVWRHPLRLQDLGEEHQAFVTKEPLEKEREHKIIGAAMGMCGKFYNYPLLLRLGWRVLKDLLKLTPARALARPAEVCSSFVQEVYRAAGIDLCPGITALPDDLAASPLLIGNYYGILGHTKTHRKNQ